MSVEEIEAAIWELPEAQVDELLHRVVSRRTGRDEELDLAVLVEARRRLADMKAGRVTAVPFEELLDELDRLAS